MNTKNMKGFTLVELLIVIALIGILSVAILATINPIEQANKARDAKVQNDSAEVMNAYERYYAGKASYPWLDLGVTPATLTVDNEFFARSSQAGFSLCTNTTITDYNTQCEAYNTAGLLVTTQELKNSFLNKGYTNLPTDTGYNFMNEIFLIKQGAINGNSIYVCYVPKANANRLNSAGSNSKLMALTVNETSGLPTEFEIADEVQIAAATYESLFADNTLFRCVPE